MSEEELNRRARKYLNGVAMFMGCILGGLVPLLFWAFGHFKDARADFAGRGVMEWVAAGVVIAYGCICMGSVFCTAWIARRSGLVCPSCGAVLTSGVNRMGLIRQEGKCGGCGALVLTRGS